MLVVKVELHSARTHKVTEIARMVLYNDGTGDSLIGNYKGRTTKGKLDHESTGVEAWRLPILREGEVKNYRRLDLHVWNLVARMLKAMEYK